MTKTHESPTNKSISSQRSGLDFMHSQLKPASCYYFNTSWKRKPGSGWLIAGWLFLICCRLIHHSLGDFTMRSIYICPLHMEPTEVDLTAVLVVRYDYYGHHNILQYTRRAFSLSRSNLIRINCYNSSLGTSIGHRSSSSCRLSKFPKTSCGCAAGTGQGEDCECSQLIRYSIRVRWTW